MKLYALAVVATSTFMYSSDARLFRGHHRHRAGNQLGPAQGQNGQGQQNQNQQQHQQQQQQPPLGPGNGGGLHDGNGPHGNGNGGSGLHNGSGPNGPRDGEGNWPYTPLSCNDDPQAVRCSANIDIPGGGMTGYAICRNGNEELCLCDLEYTRDDIDICGGCN